MTDFNFQLSTKLPTGALINVRALSAEEFSEHLTAIGEIAQEIVDTDATLVAASRVAAGGLTAVAAAPAAGQGYPSGVNTLPTGPAPAAGSLGIAQDRWGKEFVAGQHGAPLTPRGPAVKMSAISKMGKAYKQWVDPCEHPNYTGERNPADKFERQFAN